MRVYLGIDPGKSGAWVLSTDYGVECGLWSDADIDRLCEKLEERRALEDPIYAALEKVHAMPRQGVCSMFTFGENFGWWQGVLRVLKIPHILVTPQRWMKEILDSKPADRTKLKASIVDFVIRQHSPLGGKLAVKKNWGIADAYCLALYARRYYERSN